jgi:hypothetical protein
LYVLGGCPRTGPPHRTRRNCEQGARFANGRNAPGPLRGWDVTSDVVSVDLIIPVPFLDARQLAGVPIARVMIELLLVKLSL